MTSMIPLGNVGRSAIRAAKNYTKGYSDIQTKVREATSNDPWGPSGSQMNVIAQATFNQQDFIEIMEMLDKRMNDKGKNWRHVFKSLTLLDYMLHAGSENCVLYFQENIYIVKTLREFVYVDDDGKDQGANVRQKAKEITSLLMDDARMRQQRKTRSNMRDRMSGYPTEDSRRGDSDSDDDAARRNRNNRKNDRSNEDSELQRALEESRKMAGMEQERGRNNKRAEDDLEEALRLSREEEERRKRALEGNNSSLFDADNPARKETSLWDDLVDTGSSQPQPQMQMPMITGFPTTQFQSFNPYYQQQQEEMMRQQQMMEMQRQMQEQEAYNQMMQQQAWQQQQQQQMYQQQLAAQQQQQTLQPLVPQQTSIGSNNPFAAFAKPSSPPPMPTQPQAPPLAQRPASTPAQRPPKDDGKYAHLAGLLGNRDDGIDTFGNQGALRYGHAGGRLQGQATGTNPFQRQQQQQQQQQQRNDQPLLDL